uniref:helix-turn-helix transcriptional regulator n=1 Tax=Thaumasiovibrio occultus TaxID=1891184 RepID=UPI00131EA063|nr:AraC family transcriptional regulator [Thaumasiovibrio occultus]
MEKQSTNSLSVSQSTEPLLNHYKMHNGISVFGGLTTSGKNQKVITIIKPSVIFTLLLAGELNFGYDQQHCELVGGQGVGVNILAPCSFWRVLAENQRVNKLHITVPIEWFNCSDSDPVLLRQFLSNHQASGYFHLSPDMTALSQRMLNLPHPKTLLDRIYLEQMISQLLFALIQKFSEPSIDVSLFSIPIRQEEKITRIMKYIEHHLHLNFCLQGMANDNCMSVSTLQRLFKKELKTTVSQYITKRRLEAARVKLNQGAMSVSEAAYTYGYRHPSNFSNAFKKHFGYAPKVITQSPTTVNTYCPTHED